MVKKKAPSTNDKVRELNVHLAGVNRCDLASFRVNERERVGKNNLLDVRVASCRDCRDLVPHM